MGAESNSFDLQPLGDQQLDLLRYLADHGPITVGEVYKGYGNPKGLARTTVLTVMEKLRTKGYVSRRKIKGVFYYSAKNDHNVILKDLVADFVQKTLGGSLSPFVTYLADTGKLSETQLEDLKKMVDDLEGEEDPC
jgi:predicted transcriptional regulator